MLLFIFATFPEKAYISFSHNNGLQLQLMTPLLIQDDVMPLVFCD